MQVTSTFAPETFGRSQTGKRAARDGPYEDLDAFTHRADALAESLLENGITAMKIWPFDVAARETGGRYITSAQLKTCLEPFEKIRKAVGDRIEIMVEFHSLWNLPTARKIAHELAALQADSGSRTPSS